MKQTWIGVCICSAGVMLGGCEAIQAVKDLVSTPEEIVADYAVHVADIMNSTAECDKLADELHKYCSSREKVVTQAVADAVSRLSNNEITASQRDEFDKKISSLKNTNTTSCLLTPSVTIEKISCLKPVLGIMDAQ